MRDRLFRAERAAVGRLAGQRFHRQVRVDRLGAVAGEQGEVVHLACRAGLHHQPGAGAQAAVDQVLVHCRGGQQRRDRHALAAGVAVRHDQDVVALADRVDGLGTQRGQPRLDALLAPRRRIGDVQFEAAELAVGVAPDLADLGHVGHIEHRLRHFQPQRRIDVVDVQQVGLRPDEGHQRHHQLLTNRVDRRVGDLGEQLAEVLVQRLVLLGQHRQRRVVAHRADRLLAVVRHRQQLELEILQRVAERALALHQLLARGRFDAADRQVVQPDADVFDPLLVRPRVGQLVLDLAVVDDATGLHVDQQHAAGLQPPLFHDARLGHGEHAGLGSEDHQVVVGDQVTRRTQAVAVQRGADLATVGEGDRGRAVPRFHHRRVVFVERAAVVVHQRVTFPRLGNHHHHRVRQRVAGHGQQFEAVVERGGVGLARVDQRPQLGQVLAEHRRGDCAGARVEPVDVALDRVDLAIVRDHAVGMGELPGGKRVGGKALVHHRQRGDRARVGEVGVVGADLAGQQQALVDHGAAGHRGHEVLAPVLEVQRADRVAGGLADHVELALQRVGHHHVRAAADEQLADHRFAGFHRFGHRHRVVDRHVAPAQHALALRAYGAFQLLLAGAPRGVFLGQEDHAHAVLARRRQGDLLPRHLLAVELVGQLDEDAGAVAHQRIGAHRAAVIQVAQDLQTLRDDLVAAPPLDVRHEPHATGVVLVPWIVQTLRARLIHGRFQEQGGVPTIVRCSKRTQANSIGRLYGRLERFAGADRRCRAADRHPGTARRTGWRRAVLVFGRWLC